MSSHPHRESLIAAALSWGAIGGLSVYGLAVMGVDIQKMPPIIGAIILGIAVMAAVWKFVSSDDAGLDDELKDRHAVIGAFKSVMIGGIVSALATTWCLHNEAVLAHERDPYTLKARLIKWAEESERKIFDFPATPNESGYLRRAQFGFLVSGKKESGPLYSWISIGNNIPTNELFLSRTAGFGKMPCDEYKVLPKNVQEQIEAKLMIDFMQHIPRIRLALGFTEKTGDFLCGYSLEAMIPLPIPGIQRITFLRALASIEETERLAERRFAELVRENAHGSR